MKIFQKLLIGAKSLFIGILFTPLYTTAQTYNIGSDGSDYTLTLKVSGMNTSFCYCSQSSTQVIAARYSYGNASRWIDVSLAGGTAACTTSHIVGPNYTANHFLSIYYEGRKLAIGAAACWVNTADCSGSVSGVGARPNGYSATTRWIKAPTNVQASEESSDSYIDITWDKGTDIPDAMHKYIIYQGTTFIDTVSGDLRTYRHTGLDPGQSYTYQVKTFTNSFGSGPHESFNTSGSSDVGTTFSMQLTASDAEYISRTLLRWNDVSAYADEIEISRIDTNGTDTVQIGVVSKYSRQFSDYEGIPGYTYQYMVKPVKIGVEFWPDFNFGTRKQNGVLKGKVLSPLNAGVSGVTVHATATVDVYGTSVVKTYSAVTDNSGYYEIKDIYYHKEASFKVYPQKTRHMFKPDTLTRKLDLDNPKIASIDFTDTTVFTIIGYAKYPIEGGASTAECGIQGVKILLDSTEVVRTDASGRFSFVVQDEGTYNIRAQYEHHQFHIPDTNLLIEDDVLNLQFFDVQKDTIFIKVQGGCNTSLADSVKVRIRSEMSPACYDTTFYTNASGNAQIVVAARAYKVEVVDLFPPNSNIFDQISDKKVKVNLTARDSVAEINTTYTVVSVPELIYTIPDGKKDTIPGYLDTTSIEYDTFNTAVTPRADFIYRGPISIDINWADAADQIVCMTKPTGGTEDIPKMEKGGTYGITIDVYETTSKCAINEGNLRIYDYVSDLDKNAQNLPIVKGRAEYVITVGNPNIASGGQHPNQKLFYMLAEVGFLDPIPSESWILVTGSQPRDKTFSTRSAGIPFVVLHDPPGDQSYAYVEKGSTFSTFTKTEKVWGGSGGIKSEVRIGVAFLTPFSESKLGVAIDIDARAGRDNNNKAGTVTSFTFKERFSTSQAEALTGYPGDVFVGAAFNMVYSLADAIDYDAVSCNIKRDTVLAIDPVGFATTFIYTEDYIEQVLLPNLREVRKLATADSALAFQLDIDNWEGILSNNRKNRDSLAIPIPGAKGNISISTGATYDGEYVYDTVSSGSYEYKTFFNREVFLGLQNNNKSGAWAETKAGAVITATNSFTSNTGGDTTQTRTVGYHIEDNDRGDYHSIDILKDTKNGVPAFRLVGGATSCPHEPNTQRRYLGEISIYPPERNNVPSNGEATFTVNLVNNSQSDETQTYAIRVLPESNLDGAIIKIGGTVINNSPAYYTIPPRQLMQVKLTVARGPLATTYKGLQILISAGCEWDDLYELVSSDVVTFDVNFQSECSEVGIYRPVENWVHNASMGDYMDMAFSNYDANDENLESLILQYRRAGKGWEEAIEVPKDSLKQKFYDVRILNKHWPNGDYELRAMANCKDKISQVRYSDLVPGKVDRSPLSMFGTAYPSDGILNIEDVIMVEFDKDIDQSIAYVPGKIALQRDDTKEFIPITYSIKDGQLIIKTSPDSLIDKFEGIKLNAVVSQIEDLSGNQLPEPIIWSFVVNRSPVYWAPRNIAYSVERGSPGSFTAALKNVGPSMANFTLSKYPLWLIPGSLSGTVAGLGGSTDIDFTLVSDINPGTYIDTIIAESGGYKLMLVVKVEVVTPAPKWVGQTLNPADFQYNMSGIFQFSVTDLDAPLSADTKDAIGVFINDSLRGRGYIQYVPQLRKYMAFVTIYSTSTNLDSMQFRMWDANPGLQYLAKESKAFKANSVLGQSQSPFIMHPQGVFQTIYLTKGWNWFSLFVKNPNSSPQNLFADAFKDTLTVVKKHGEYVQYLNSTWHGDFDTLYPGEGYMINVPQADTVEIYGAIAGAIHTPIEGNNTWTWVGNTDLFGTSVNDKLGNLTSEDGDIIKSEDAFALYNNSIGKWVGNLSYIDPGSAYKIRTAVPGEFKTTKLYKILPDWNLAYSAYEYNMNITSELLMGSQRVDDSHFILGAFIDGVCQGVGQPIYSKELNRFVIYLTVFGDSSSNGKPIILKLYDTDLASELAINYTVLQFTGDNIVGTVSRPTPVSIKALGINPILVSGIAMNTYPNPFDNDFFLKLKLPNAVKTDIYMVDVMGRRMVSIYKGDLTHGLSEFYVRANHLSRGVYYLVVEADGQIMQRMVIRQ